MHKKSGNQHGQRAGPAPAIFVWRESARLPCATVRHLRLVRASTMKKTILAAALLILTLASLAPAGTIKIPKDEPAATVKVPESWKPEETDRGYAVESPDKVATVLLEASTKKGVKKLIEENVEWLTKEQDVKVDEASKKDQDFELAGRSWSRISWDADSKEFGPSVVGFLFSEVGQGKLLTVTYWITKKDSEKHMDTIEKILSSVKPVEE
jgi:hypothetical protein